MDYPQLIAEAPANGEFEYWQRVLLEQFWSDAESEISDGITSDKFDQNEAYILALAQLFVFCDKMKLPPHERNGVPTVEEVVDWLREGERG